MDAQKKSSLYYPLLIRIPLSVHAINVSYVEVIDENCMDMNHVHSCHEICVCLENSITVRAGSHEYKLEAGEFLLIMPGTPHYILYNPNETRKYFITVFAMPTIEEDDEINYPLVTKVRKLSRLEFAVKGACQINDVMTILNKMETEIDEKKTGWSFMFRGYCLEFLILCLRDILHPVSETTIIPRNLNLAIEITKFMQNNYHRRLTLKDIASAFHVSTRHAQRIFTDFFGVSYAKALNLFRMNYAKDLLVNTDHTIAEITELVGLSSAQALYRLFREHERVSINEYRMIHKSFQEQTHE